MRTTIIPAQITTVEDKIAGSLNMTQLLLLMIPILWATILYALIPPRFLVVWYKLPLLLNVSLVCFILAMRFKGKVIFSWLLVLLKFNMRPKYYVFDKNDTYLRVVDLPPFEKNHKKLFKKAPAQATSHTKVPALSISDLVILETMLQNRNYSFSIKTNQKGGFNVDLSQVKK